MSTAVPDAADEKKEASDVVEGELVVRHAPARNINFTVSSTDPTRRRAHP